MRRLRYRGLCAVLVVLSLGLGGCGSKNTVVNYQDAREDITSIAFFGNKYEPENVSLKGNEYYEALRKRMAAGKGDDVFMVNHDIVLELEAEGQLADLSELSTIPEYTDQMLSQMRSDGVINWVPTTVSVFGLYCNLDLLREHNQKVPGNLHEWENVCDYFVKQGITPIIANNDISLKTLAIGRGFYSLYQEGLQEEAYTRLNQGEENLSEYLTTGFSIAEDFISKAYIDAGKAVNTKKTSDDLQEFVKGESPFMLTGAWAAGRVELMEPGFDFQVVPYPILEDGELLVINADTRLSVNADSSHVEAAKRFVEYFTQPENIQRFADQQSSFIPLKSGNPSSVKEIQPLIPCYQSGRIVIGTDGLLNLPIWELTAQVSEKLLSGEPLDSAMEWMDQQAAEERKAP